MLKIALTHSARPGSMVKVAPRIFGAALVVVTGVVVPSTAQAVGNSRFGDPAEVTRAAPADLLLGVYDPYGAFAKDGRIGIEHLYVPWKDVDLTTLDRADQYAAARGRQLLLTVEPWSWAFAKRESFLSLHSSIMSGRSDRLIASVCSKIGKLASKVTIRWGHEMDLKNNRYPWSGLEPEQFIEAYRYFVDACRKQAPQAAFMWSPRGEANSAAFYPGNSYVDAVGLSVFAYQKYDQGEFGRNRSVSEILKPSYVQAIQYKKPTYIAEFGCNGDDEYQRRCLDELTSLSTNFPALSGLVIFNEVETSPWPKDYGFPDWRIGPIPQN